MNSERKAFEGVFTSSKGWDLTFINGVYQNQNTNNAYAGWKASAQRQGYKLVPVDHINVIRDALVIACDSGKDYQKYEDSLNYIHKAMIGAVDE